MESAGGHRSRQGAGTDQPHQDHRQIGPGEQDVGHDGVRRLHPRKGQHAAEADEQDGHEENLEGGGRCTTVRRRGSVALGGA